MVPKRKKIAMYAAMVIITAIVVFPFLWMVLLSFKSSSEIMSICSKFDFIQYASSDSIFETASYGN